MNNQSGMGKLRVIIAALAIAGLAGAGLTGCADATSDDAPAVAAPSAPPVTSAVVIQRAVTETQEFSGRLEAIEVVAIRPRVSGYITAVNFKPGAEVKKGEVLFVIDPRPYQAEADRTKAIAAAAQARAGLARLELQRAELLLADKAIAQREFDERAAGQKELDASVRAAQAEHETARLNLAYTRVTSPIDGRVSKAEITLGNLVDATAVLTSVVSLERIYASFDGDESTYLRVSRRTNAGQPVDVKVGLAGEEGFPHSGKLEFVDNQLDPAVQKEKGIQIPFAGPDNRTGAKLVGDYLAKQLKAGDKVGILEGVSTTFNAQQRTLGFNDAMKAASVSVVGVIQLGCCVT